VGGGLASTVAEMIGRLRVLGERLSEDGLIRFDLKVLITLIAIVTTFGTLSALGIHCSSIGSWNKRVADHPGDDPGHLWGKPLDVRSDEWAVVAPLFLSQLQMGMPVRNPNIGGKRAALVSAPTKTFYSLLTLRYWGCFLLPLDGAFAYFTNFYHFAVLFSAFLFLLLLTGNQYWLSLMGAAWVTFSSFVQWWDGVAMLFWVAWAFIGASYLLFSTRRPFIVAATGILVLALESIGTATYPPWLVVFGYLTLALLVALLLDSRRRARLLALLRFRLACAAVGLVLLTACVASWYFYVFPTLRDLLHTEYPGKRSAGGGGTMEWIRVFSGFYDYGYSETNFPTAFGNVCEASSFILLFPVVMLSTARQLARGVRFDRVQLALIGYVAVLFTWMSIGLPKLLARATLLDLSPPGRSLAGLGVASIILTVAHLGRRTLPAGWPFRLLAPLACGGLFLFHGSRLHASPFFTWQRIATVSIWGTAISFALLDGRRWLFALLLGAMLWPNLLIHPWYRGLAPFTEKDLYRRVRALVVEDPKGGWAVFGGAVLANFLKSTGARVINGTNYVPDLERWGKLDPTGEHRAAYNRYGHASLQQREDDQVSYSSVVTDGSLDRPGDLFWIGINPCSEKLALLGVRYVAFAEGQPLAGLKCRLESLGTHSGWRLYRLP
jgi:hypothetical protein